MIASLTFRAATPDDVGFLVDAVRISERVPIGRETSLYESIFGLSREEVDAFLAESLLQDVGGCQLSYRTFHVLADGERPVACCSAWVEAARGAPSGRLVAMTISRFIGVARWKARMMAIRALSASVPSRTPMTLQLESFYTRPEFRGQGATSHLIDGAIAALASRDVRPRTAEISLLAENVGAARAYMKSGFEHVWSTSPGNPRFRELTGSAGFIQMRREIGW